MTAGTKQPKHNAGPEQPIGEQSRPKKRKRQPSVGRSGSSVSRTRSRVEWPHLGELASEVDIQAVTAQMTNELNAMSLNLRSQLDAEATSVASSPLPVDAIDRVKTSRNAAGPQVTWSRSHGARGSRAQATGTLATASHGIVSNGFGPHGLGPNGLGPQRTFKDPTVEREFISFCQMVCPVTLTDAQVEAKREELLELAAGHVWHEEFELPNAEELICSGSLLEPMPEREEALPESCDAAQRFANLCSTRLLTKPEEKTVFKRLHYLKYLANQLLQADDIDQWTLARAEGLLRAANWHRCLVVQANMRLVVSIVRKMPVRPCCYDELVSDGTVALLRSLDKYDPTRGTRFCTYATPVIQRECFLSSQNQREDRVRCTQSAALSMLASVKGLADRNEETRAERNHWMTWRRKLAGLIDHLTRREQIIIRSRYCLGAHKHVKTLQRLADALKISKERVRQLETKALDKLRKLAGEM